MERPEAWTPIERYNIELHGPGPMLRVGVFQAAELIAGAAFIVAWGPRKGTTGPGFCVAPHTSMGQPFPYDSDTKALPPDIEAQHLLELAADMAMNGAPFALLDAAFLVFPAWRAMTIHHGYVAHTPDGAWNPHNPDYPDEVLEAYRRDRNMFQTRIDHDLGKRLPTVEVVTGFGTVARN